MSRSTYKEVLLLLICGHILNISAEYNTRLSLITVGIAMVAMFKLEGIMELKLEAYGSQAECRNSIIYLICGIAVYEMLLGDIEVDIIPLMCSFSLCGASKQLVSIRKENRAMTREEIKSYKKLWSMQKICLKGLNIHEFYPCRSFSELYKSYEQLGRVCTIRTDKAGVDQGSELKFYIANEISLEKLKKIWNEIESNKCIAIISNGTIAI